MALPSEAIMNKFPGLVVEHFLVKFGVMIAASIFEISCGKQTDKRQ